jgi:hypothetical protein
VPDGPTPLLPHIEGILDAACRAPSWGNSQPWRFHVDGETLSILVDRERQTTGSSASARIAVGAALECALVRAGRMGATVRFETPRAGALVTITVSGVKRIPEPDKALVRRTTNRRPYDGRALDDATHEWLVGATPPLDGARTHWFGRERVRVLGPLLEEAEVLYYGIPRLRALGLRAIRFDVRDRGEVSHGLSLASMELSAAERLAIDALRHTPGDGLAPAGALQKMGARARRLVESASGVCIITQPDTDDPAAAVSVGRCMQRAWLTLTRRGLVAQPMTTVQALGGVLGVEGSSLPEHERVEALLAKFVAAFPSVEKGASIALLMRYGWAPLPTMHVGRLPVGESVVQESGP